MAWWDSGAYGAAPGSTQIPGSTAASSLAGVRPQLNRSTLAKILSVLGQIGKTAGKSALMMGKATPLGSLVQAGEYGVLSGLGKTQSPWAQSNYFARQDQLERERRAREDLSTQRTEADILSLQNKNRMFPLEEQEQQRELDKLDQDIQINEDELARIEAAKKAAPYDVRAQEALEHERKLRQAELDYKLAQKEELESRKTANIALAGYREAGGGRKDLHLSTADSDRARKNAERRALAELSNTSAMMFGLIGAAGILDPKERAAFDANVQKYLPEEIEKLKAIMSTTVSLGSITTTPPGAISAGGNEAIIDNQLSIMRDDVEAPRKPGEEPPPTPTEVLNKYISSGDLDPNDPVEAEIIVRFIKEYKLQ